jgi:hypothetical protein
VALSARMPDDEVDLMAELDSTEDDCPRCYPGTCECPPEEQPEVVRLRAEVKRLSSAVRVVTTELGAAMAERDQALAAVREQSARAARAEAGRDRVLALADRMDALYDQGYTITDGDAGEGADALPERVRADMLDAPRRLPALIRAAVNGPPEQAEGARWKATRSNTDLYEGDCPDGTRCDRPCRDQCDRLIAEECGGNTAAPPTTGEVASG